MSSAPSPPKPLADHEPRTGVHDAGLSHTAWAAVCVVLLAIACGYTALAFRLDFLNVHGRPGPGFFPRTVGLALVASVIYALARNWRRAGTTSPDQYRRATLLFGLAGLLFTASLAILGAWVSMCLYLFFTLAYFNPRRHFLNLVLTLTIPLVFYLLFDVWLGVLLPEGMLF